MEACRDGAIRYSHEYNLASTNKDIVVRAQRAVEIGRTERGLQRLDRLAGLGRVGFVDEDGVAAVGEDEGERLSHGRHPEVIEDEEAADGDKLVGEKEVDEDGVEEVFGRVDGGAWFPLQLRMRTVSAGDWLAPLPGGLSKGSHNLTVRAVDRRELSGEQTIEFPIDPSGRFTAVPRVRPAVAATDFC